MDNINTSFAEPFSILSSTVHFKMDPEVQSMLAKKSDADRYCAVAYAFACLLTGPVPFQSPEYDIFPDYDDEIDYDGELKQLELKEVSSSKKKQDTKSKTTEEDGKKK